MKETSKITYDFGKLKRFLTVVRLMMQDTVLTLVKRCYYKLYNYLLCFIPSNVVIKNPSSIENFYNEDSKSAKKLEHRPLFIIDLIKT